MISLSIVVWHDGLEAWKERFFVNLSKQFKHWLKGSVRMVTLLEYDLELERGEKMVSVDIQAGHRHFRLAPQLRDWFVFRNDGLFYRCIAFSFVGVGSRCDLLNHWHSWSKKVRQRYRVLAAFWTTS
jgi:hypothetical protein